MDLFLKFRNRTCNFSGIVLKDFNVPVVNEVELDFQIEPAIWFKSLIIESILIDCDLRNVYWKRKGQTSNDELGRSIFDDNRLEECELFNSVVRLVRFQEKKSCKIKDSSKEILRILHIHVLPAIILRKEDLPFLNEALTIVEGRLSYLNEKLVEKDTEKVETERLLHDQKELLFQTENFDDKKYMKTCSETFLTYILDDAIRDINSLTEKLVTYQSCVDMSGNPATDDAKLNHNQWRKKRDEVQSAILKLQSIREAVQNQVAVNKKKSKKSKTAINHKHEDYITLKAKASCYKTHIKSLFDGKIKTTAVREAIIQACKDLLVSGETTGHDLAKSGERVSTDVLGAYIKPKKWLTLEDKIFAFLTNKSCEVSEVYKIFYTNTAKKITDFLEEQLLFDRKREANIPFFMDMTDFTLPPRKEKPNPNSNAYENVSLNRSVSVDTPCLRFIHMIKEEVTQHIFEQSQLLVQLLSKKSSSEKKTLGNDISVNKVWVYYESQLYLQLIEQLLKLYEYAYREKATKMSSFMLKSSLESLGIQEQWLKECVDAKPSDKSLICPKEQQNCFDRNVAIVSMRKGSSLTVSDLCETNEEIRNFFGCSPNSYEPTSVNTCSDNVEVFLRGTTKYSEHVSETNDTKTRRIDTFRSVITEIENMIRSKSIMGKLKSISRANRLTSECVSRLKAKHCGISDDTALNAEDMLSGTICVLSRLNENQFKQLFVNIQLTNDMIPPFMMGSIQDWSLTNFFCAFQCVSCQIDSSEITNN